MTTEEDRLLKFQEVRKYIPFSLNTILEKAKNDPRLVPKKFGRSRVWLYSDIQSVVKDFSKEEL